jgi:cytidine deaminase
VTLKQDNLTLEDQELVNAARSAIDANTDAMPDADGVHTMGAAVRTVDGTIFVGVNLYHFTGGPCAELVALGAARAGGARELQTIVAVGNHGRGVVGPCGRDRQVLLDYYPDVRVLVPTVNGVMALTPRQLLPAATDWTFEHGSVPAQRSHLHG